MASKSSGPNHFCNDGSIKCRFAKAEVWGTYGSSPPFPLLAVYTELKKKVWKNFSSDASDNLKYPRTSLCRSAWVRMCCTTSLFNAHQEDPWKMSIRFPGLVSM